MRGFWLGALVVVVGAACGATEDTTEGADAGAVVPVASVAAVPDGYVAGGLLGRYVAGDGKAPGELPAGTPFLVRLEAGLDYPAGAPGLAELADGGAFVARYEGALRVDEAGAWRVGLTVAGGAVLRLGGEELIDAWDAPDPVTQLVLVDVEAGWIPLEIVYRRLPLATHLQLWAGPESALVEPAAGDALGWPSTPPTGEPALAGEATVTSTTPYRATLHIECTAPARVTVKVEGPAASTVAPDALAHVHDVPVPLAPGATYTLRVSVKDLWGREQAVGALDVTTPAVPDYTAGGLLGRYFQGKAFETPVAARVDEGVDLPTDGDTAGSYGIPMQADGFSVRWEGGVDVPKAGDWTFHAGGDDGQRLWVDGLLVADLWTDHGFTVASGTVPLEAGWHTVLMEHYESGGAAQVRLEWEGPGTARQVIPAGRLGWVPPTDLAGAPTVGALTARSGPATDRVRASWTTGGLARCTAKVAGADAGVAGALATGFLLDVEGVAPGPATVTVTCQAPDGTVKQTADATAVLPAPPAGAEVLDAFDGEAFEGWTTKDEVPSHEATVELLGGTLRVGGNPGEAGGEDGNPGGTTDPGWLAWTGEARGDGVVTTHAWVGDGGSAGLLVALKDADSWVRADLDGEAGLVRLVRSQDGTLTELGRAEGLTLPQGTWFELAVERTGDALSVRVDGQEQLAATAADLPAGKLGLYVWQSDHTRFDHLSFAPAP